MILLDTNVLSEMLRPQPSPAVVDWLNAQPAASLYISTITTAEMLFGIEALAAGKRQDALKLAFHALCELMVTRPLAFDEAAAARYGVIAAAARRAGKGLPTAGGFIAAIAHARGFAVATRDTAPFLAAGLQVINPWEA
jgi:predicted nucleic acid-binding protein